MSTLICYDGSPSAKHAVVKAAPIIGSRDVTVLHVWNESPAFPADSFGGGGQTVTQSHELQTLETVRTQTIAEEGRELADAHGLHATSLTACNESTAGRRSCDSQTRWTAH